MTILTQTNIPDYELLDSGNGKRLERFGTYTLVRPDPDAIWNTALNKTEWGNADAVFEKTTHEKGVWNKKHPLPSSWNMQYKTLTFSVKLGAFKHTGVFPEQSANWEFLEKTIQKEKTKNPARRIKVLNLFAYTGIASLVSAAHGAEVTHVDASKSTIGWAKENQLLSQLQNHPIRWIVDDAITFVERELRRNNSYDGIILDPPAFGHGPSGKSWKFHDHFPKLLSLCTQLLSPDPLFMIVNAYAISSSSLMLKTLLEQTLQKNSIEYGELALAQKNSSVLLSTGIFARWGK